MQVDSLGNLLQFGFCGAGCRIPVGYECWSLAKGAAPLGCITGTQCAPWTPDGGSWDWMSPWYCLYSTPLTEGETCNYDQRTHLCDPGLLCINEVCTGKKMIKNGFFHGHIFIQNLIITQYLIFQLNQQGGIVGLKIQGEHL